MKRWVGGTICSLLIIFFSLVSGIQFSNGWTIGDYIYKFLNQPPWSNGLSGTHYSAIATLILLFAGVICLMVLLESAPTKLAKRLKLITLIAVLCWPLLVSSGEQLVMRYSTGINAIEYDKRISTCNFKDGDDGRILVSGSFHLTNHGEKPVKFYIKIKSNSNNDVLQGFFGDGLVLRNKDNTNETFVLDPNEVRTFQIESYAINPSNSHMSLSMGTPTVVLFNEQGEKTFAR